MGCRNRRIPGRLWDVGTAQLEWSVRCRFLPTASSLPAGVRTPRSGCGIRPRRRLNRSLHSRGLPRSLWRGLSRWYSRRMGGLVGCWNRGTSGSRRDIRGSGTWRFPRMAGPWPLAAGTRRFGFGMPERDNCWLSWRDTRTGSFQWHSLRMAGSWPLAVGTSQLQATLEGHRDRVSSVAFSPDGSSLTSARGPTGFQRSVSVPVAGRTGRPGAQDGCHQMSAMMQTGA